MALIDPQGIVQEMNSAARQLLPASLDPVGSDFATLPFWSTDPEATSSTLHEALARCLEGQSYRVPATIELPDGSERQLDFSLTPVRSGDTTFAVVAEARDLLAPGDS
jgi:PAS domain-containing protein